MKKLLLLSLVLLSSISLNAQKTNTLNTLTSSQSILVNMGCEGANCAGLTVDNTSGGVVLTSSVYNPTVTDQAAGFSRAQRADCYNTGAKIWVTDNGVITLAASKGRAVLDGGTFSIYGYTNISNFHAIRDAAVSSTLYCDYYRQQ